MSVVISDPRAPKNLATSLLVTTGRVSIFLHKVFYFIRIAACQIDELPRTNVVIDVVMIII